jgi:hypothetical protein
VQTAPDQSRSSSSPRQSGAASTSPRFALLAALALAACAPQTPPVLAVEDNTGGSVSATAAHPVEVHEAVGRALDAVRPEPRPEVL